MKILSLGFLALLVPSLNPAGSPVLSDNLKIEFRRTSLLPGSAIAIKNSSAAPLIACSYGRCKELTNKWELFGISINEEVKHKMFFYIPQKGWSFFEFILDKNLFTLKAPSKIRLPAQVEKTLENKDDTIANEAKYNKQIFKKSSLAAWPCQWEKPLKSVAVSQFGSVRTLASGLTYHHKGLDLRARSLTPIRSVADGTVLSTDDQVVGGKTINIDHGKGVISRYLHLTEFKVSAGQSIKAGELVALSGTSGRAEAPHLHWEMRVHGIAVDPLELLDLMPQICDLK